MMTSLASVFWVLTVLIHSGSPASHQIQEDNALQTVRRLVAFGPGPFKDADAESLTSAIKTLNPMRETDLQYKGGDGSTYFSSLFQPYLWEFTEKNKQTSLVLMEASKTSLHPGVSHLRITLLDRRGKMQFDTVFTTGHRCYLSSVEIVRTNDGNYPLIKLATKRGNGPGPDIARQYYAKIGNRVDLIRLEASNLAATRNDLRYEHFRCGPRVPSQSVDEWEADLNSKERPKILRTLAWIGSVRFADPGGRSGGKEEDPEDRKKLRELCARISVSSRLKELGESKDDWMRQAAALAMYPKQE